MSATPATSIMSEYRGGGQNVSLRGAASFDILGLTTD
jgi:hypothetical protein